MRHMNAWVTSIMSTLFDYGHMGESGPRYGLWHSSLGVGQIVGGLVSFAAQHGPQGKSANGEKSKCQACRRVAPVH